MASVIAVKLNKCVHFKQEQKIIRTVNHSTTLYNLFEDVHGKVNDIKSVTVEYTVSANLDGSAGFQSEGQISVGDLNSRLGIKYVSNWPVR